MLLFSFIEIVEETEDGNTKMLQKKKKKESIY